jgi:hypothetical protein
MCRGLSAGIIAAPAGRSGVRNCGGLSDLTPQSDKNVSRETVLSDWGRKPYKTTYVRQGETRAIAR